MFRRAVGNYVPSAQPDYERSAETGALGAILHTQAPLDSEICIDSAPIRRGQLINALQGMAVDTRNSLTLDLFQFDGIVSFAGHIARPPSYIALNPRQTPWMEAPRAIVSACPCRQ